MRPVINKLFAVLLCLSLLFAFVPAASAALPGDITASTTISGTGYDSFSFLTDGDQENYRTSGSSASITLKNSFGMAGLYLLFDLEYGSYTITDVTTGQVFTAGTNRMLHEYIDLQTAFGTCPTELKIAFDNGSVRLSELYVFTDGTLPDFVQTWQAPLDGKADLVLFATHGDDDQLFFAGLLPYYATRSECAVQVVYLTDHRNLTKARTHEMLNGLWAVGVRAYPVFGQFADFRIDDLKDTYDEYRYSYGVSETQLQSFVVEQIRRFRPQVAVGHDLQGEYGHGMHMVYADLLVKALEITGDASQFPESAQKWGTWDIPKLYLHLYDENTITMNWDVPLDAFDGMTAFQVTQKYGYPCHKSQQYTWFTRWINGSSGEITKATQIDTYSPCKFGLYRSTVGPDAEKNDLLENIIPYATQERLEQERLEQERLEQERLEQERLEQERLEQERLEQERLEQERLEQERLEQERLEQERLEQERLEQERLEQEQLEQKKQQKQLTIALIFLGILLLALFCVLPFAFRRKRK